MSSFHIATLTFSHFFPRANPFLGDISEPNDSALYNSIAEVVQMRPVGSKYAIDLTHALESFTHSIDGVL
jgi:hypothetical protein